MKRYLLLVAVTMLFSATAHAEQTKYSPGFPADGPWLLAGYDGVCHSIKDEYGVNTPKDLYQKLVSKGEDAEINQVDENNVAILDLTQKNFPTLYVVRGIDFCQHLASELLADR